MVEESTAGSPVAGRGRRLVPGLTAAIRDGRFGRRLGLIAMLVGFMLALSEVEALVGEREAMRGEAEAAVGALWGPAQRVVGPFLLVPEDRVRGSGSDLDVDTVHHVATPRDLEIAVTLATEARRRGLFDIPVYTADLAVTGRFDEADLAVLAKRGASLEAPLLAIRLSDAGGIVGIPEAAWNGEPAAVTPDLLAPVRAILGQHAFAVRLGAPGGDGRFEVTMRLRGTGRLLLGPAGRSTAVSMTSKWPHPSFVGSRTAETHRITSEGFEAAWRVGPFGRSTPSSWTAGPPAAENPVDAFAAQAFGVALVQPVDPYRMTGRVLKYGMLFALYTFGAFLVLEVVFARPLHWLSHALTGASVATFFLLLLSLSEMIGFTAAYAAGAAGVVLQTGLYAGSVIGDRRLAVGFAGLLAVLYGGLFGLLRLEDTALVAGSLGLFAAIGLAMLLTRRLTARPVQSA